MAGIFAALGFIAMVLMAYFQWRTVHGLAQISAVLPSAGALGAGRTLAALGPGELPSVSVGVSNSNRNLLGALGELEKRILGLEQASRPALKFEDQSALVVQPGKDGRDAKEENRNSAEQAGERADSPDALLAKGQALLDKDEPAAALAQFEEAVEKYPSHSEAMVKKGSALERLGRLQEAVECYDQAIAANDSLTLAYLHKGGLFNRMEKFAEALDCYEKALHTQEKRQG
jgi:tetratricopeptide (TPR) repeat protein